MCINTHEAKTETARLIPTNKHNNMRGNPIQNRLTCLIKEHHCFGKLLQLGGELAAFFISNVTRWSTYELSDLKMSKENRVARERRSKQRQRETEKESGAGRQRRCERWPGR